MLARPRSTHSSKRKRRFSRAGDAGALARTIDRRLDAAAEKPDRLLIYVDQWEELYAMAPPAEDKERLRRHSDEVEKFIALLLAATSGAGSRASVVHDGAGRLLQSAHP